MSKMPNASHIFSKLQAALFSNYRQQIFKSIIHKYITNKEKYKT